MMQRCLISLLTLIITQTTFAMPSVQDAFTRHYPYQKGKTLDNCSTCHIPNIRDGINRYALDLRKFGYDFKKIESRDSDKDGITNITEITKSKFPGSKNSDGKTMFIFKNKKGNVHFNHQAHMTQAGYNIKFACSKCHNKNGFKREFGGTKDFVSVAHKQCLECHTRNNPLSTKAAIKCSDCHGK